MKKTQGDRILDLLRKRGEIGVKVFEFMTPRPNGLGVSQYGARILELRRKGFNIINSRGLFVLKEE